MRESFRLQHSLLTMFGHFLATLLGRLSLTWYPQCAWLLFVMSEYDYLFEKQQLLLLLWLESILPGWASLYNHRSKSNFLQKLIESNLISMIPQLQKLKIPFWTYWFKAWMGSCSTFSDLIGESHMTFVLTGDSIILFNDVLILQEFCHTTRPMNKIQIFIFHPKEPKENTAMDDKLKWRDAQEVCMWIIPVMLHSLNTRH